MSSLKISLITVTHNAANTLERCIGSVIAQTYPNLEYIIIDGQSTDNTALIINKYQETIHRYVSEPDNGIYDAMNKGIALATGHIVGLLNADDFFTDVHVLANVAKAFTSSGAAIVYADIDFVDKEDKIVRRWRSGKYQHGCFNRGWMPPHPAFYAKRELFNEYGGYDLQYGTAADYELMLRFMHTHKIEAYYLDKILVKMLIGGASSNSLTSRMKAWKNDFKAMTHHGLLSPVISIVLKPLRKIIQYVK